ncbi:MAG: LacI family transcriptional regulator [Actinobacteria bacterium]|nr:LacI family transcriptional regulator [Cyanobacteriota bacterium]MCL5771664.1 LacI family transcriptional regulator [Actinomycetota bacterium]
MVNIKDVSTKAGVSTATVSRYINNNGFISKELRQKIDNAIKELGYYPNMVAKSLSKGYTKVIGIIIPDITNPFFPELVRGAFDFLIKKNYHLHLCNSDNDPKKEELFLRDFKAMWVDGVIIAPSDSENRDLGIFNEITFPKVIVDREVLGVDADLIIINNKKGAYDAVSYLIQQGHKRIVYLGGSKYTLTAQKRHEGWGKAMIENGFLTEGLEFWGEFNINSGYKMMNEALKKLNSIDAVFASNDLIALGAIRAIKEKKIKIPEEISIIGFDDIYVDKFLTPALTTIKQPIYEVGVKSAELLLERIAKKNKKDITKKRIIIEGSLVIRDSVKNKIN